MSLKEFLGYCFDAFTYICFILKANTIQLIFKD